MTCPIERDPAVNGQPRTGQDGHAVDLRGRNLLKEIDLTAEEFLYLVDLAAELRDREAPRLGESTGWRAGTSR